MVLTQEICPDVRFAYPEGAYTIVDVYEDGVPVMAWDLMPHNFLSSWPFLGVEDYVAYTVLPEHITSDEY